MKRIHRLSHARDFSLLFKRGQKKDFGAFRIVARKNNLPHARFAFVAPRAVDKRAVVRNRLRRRSREWFRKRKSGMNLSLDVALLFSKEAVKIPRKKFYEILREANRFISDL